MAEQSSSVAVLGFISHTKDTQRRDAESIVYWGFQKSCLLAIELLNHFLVGKRYFPGSDPH